MQDYYKYLQKLQFYENVKKDQQYQAKMEQFNQQQQ